MNNERVFKSLCLQALSLRGMKQSSGMMKECLKALARNLTDCFVPRNDRAESFYIARCWNNKRIFESLCLRALSLRGTKQSFGMKSGSLKVFTRKLTDCHAMLAMTTSKILFPILIKLRLLGCVTQQGQRPKIRIFKI
jgi:hypothetical protein